MALGAHVIRPSENVWRGTVPQQARRKQHGRFYSPHCWLAQNGRMEHADVMPSCDGRLIRAHLIPKQQIKRLHGDPEDARSWVWACGGPQGNGGHHGMLDSSRRLWIPWTALPPQLIEFAEQIGALPWLERTYGQIESGRLSA